MSGQITVYTRVDGNEAPVLGSLVSAAIRKDGNIDYHEKVIVLIPSSMTLAYEKAIISVLNRNGILNVRVISENTLPEVVFGQAGFGLEQEDLKIINGSSRLIRVFSALKDLDSGSQLAFFRKQNVTSASQRICEAIDELSACNYDTAALESIVSRSDVPRLLKSKLMDIMNVMELMAARQRENEISEKELWDRMLSRMYACGAFRDAHVFFFGFSDLSAKYYSLIRQLTLFSRSVHICLQQYLAGTVIEKLNRYELPHRVVDCGNIALDGTNPAIISLGQSCLPKAPAAMSILNISPRPDDLRKITTYQAASHYMEAVHAVQQLIDWHREFGYDWKDIGIVVPDENSPVLSILPHVLDSAGVPYFARLTRPLILTGCSNFLMHTVDAIAKGYKKSSMIGILKSGYSPLEKDQAMRFVNYITQYNLDGNRWFDPIPQRKHIDPDDIAELNSMRQAVIEPLETLRAILSDRRANAAGQAEALYNYLIRQGVYDRLKAEEAEYTSLGMPTEADFIRQSWQATLACIDNISSGSFHDRHINMESLCAYVSLSLSASRIKFIPQTANAVLIDSPLYCVPGQLKAAVILGLQEETTERRLSLFSDSDRKWFDENRETDSPLFSMVTSGEDMSGRIQIRNYRAIVSATERLCFSASLLSHAGKPIAPSRLFKDVVDLLHRFKLDGNICGGLLADDVKPFCEDIAMEFLAEKIRSLKDYNLGSLSSTGSSDTDVLWQKALSFLTRENHGGIEQILSAMNARVHAENLPADLARRLYLSDVTSISELEAFATCPYKHFVSHGLRPVEVRDYAFQADSKGIFYHAAMKAYFDLAVKDPAFPAFTRQQVIRCFNTAVAPLIPELKEGPLGEDVFGEMQANDYIQDVRTSAVYVTFWLAKTRFRPVGCEVEFGGEHGTLPSIKLQVNPGRQVELKGTIDRFDEFVKNSGERCFRVIDLKSSPHSLDAEAVQEGYQLQLPLYLSTLSAAYPGIVPAGAYYQQIANPTVECDSDDENVIRVKAMDLVRVNGVTLQDDDIIDAMGNSAKTSRSNSGSLSFLDNSGMNEMLQNAQDKAIQHIRNMDQGVISIRPIQVNKINPCKYCKSKDICRMDHNLPGGYVLDIQGRPVNPV